MSAMNNGVLDATVQVMQTLIEQGKVDAERLPEITEKIGGALAALQRRYGGLSVEAAEQAGAGAATTDAALSENVVPQEPAVPIGESVQPDYIVCLEDGRKMKMLKRHLRNAYGMTPEQYRAKWNLPEDYPMVAPRYREMRRRMATRAGGGGFTGTSKTDSTAGDSANANRAAA